ncbi:hypothetical protein EXIGLDRAFT_841118 [Exidia glandulosa HHB12029]|uniref:BTB domain-containing protein n=1 Tax=Exidia glandulosa HHB12029 TaxID=1314781 RepID=A0A165E2T6_EXIGL|nr:hypothetical protein EXIGLDRAFT_841118 [Exidia glandulosa HHB12029]
MNTVPQSEIEVLRDAVSHDLHFYKPDGNVVLQAEQTLFRVHRSFLADLSPVLKDMLELPLSDELSVEGLEDAHPIVLAGDTAEEVRSLLWAIYSRPDEIASFRDEAPMNAQCIRFLQIMRLTHKYDCSKLMGWAFNIVRSKTRPNGFYKDFTASLTTIDCIVQLHPLGIRGFTNWAEPLIRHTVGNKNTVHIAVIRLLSSVRWPWLEKYLYYRLLCLGTASWKALTLTDEERMRLLAGYHNLRELWAKLSTERLDIKHNCAAAARVQCMASCLDLWLELCTLPHTLHLQLLLTSLAGCAGLSL